MSEIASTLKSRSQSSDFISLPQQTLLSTYRIAPHDTKQYTSKTGARRFITEKLQQFEGKFGSQYIALENVSAIVFTKLEAEWDPLPRVRVLYDRSDEILIIKFPSKQHDEASLLFSDILGDQFLSLSLRMRDFMRLTGSGRQRFDNVEKEPDASFVPRLTRSREDFPSLVVEVGLSESTQRLRQDAHIWLDMSNESTNIVIVISLDTSSRLITFERWQRANRVHPRVSRCGDSARQVASCVQTVVVNGDNGTVTGAPLYIPITLLLDELPNLPSDVSLDGLFSISSAKLQEICEKLKDC